MLFLADSFFSAANMKKICNSSLPLRSSPQVKPRKDVYVLLIFFQKPCFLIQQNMLAAMDLLHPMGALDESSLVNRTSDSQAIKCS